MKKNVIVSLADANYFPLLEELINSIRRFKESESIQKTIRKPDEKLKEFHNSGKIKLRDYLDNINAVEIKLNGRINPETILLKAVR